MAKVCLDCGTPKLGKRCHYCRAVTLTHDGEAREPLCQRCSRSRPDGSCGWSFIASNAHLDRAFKQFARTTIDGGFRQGALYTYRCPDDEFRQHPNRDRVPSPNPLSPQEVQRIKLFRDVPSAFWLDPRYDDRDPRRGDFWSLPMGAKGAVSLAAATALAAALVILAPKSN